MLDDYVCNLNARLYRRFLLTLVYGSWTRKLNAPNTKIVPVDTILNLFLHLMSTQFSHHDPFSRYPYMLSVLRFGFPNTFPHQNFLCLPNLPCT